MKLEKFGAEFIDAQGALDRDHMRNHAFTHPQAKHTLESIIHPLVAQETQRQADAAHRAGHRTLVFDVPLLVESGVRWLSKVDRVLVIDCSVQTQIQRGMARSALSQETVEAIIATQAPRVKKLAAADWVINNDKITFDALRQLVQTLPI